MTKIIGLTGGIGSGKSTVAQMFADLGVPVYIADDEAKKITNTSSTLKIIEAQFGVSVIEKGKLNRVAMAKIVFGDSEKLKQLNQIIHPLVADHFEKWLLENSKARFVIKETAILFETNNHLTCDFVITVTAPEAVRIARVKQRDKSSEDEIRDRMNHQWTDEQRLALSDFVIVNLDLESTTVQVMRIFKQLTKKSK